MFNNVDSKITVKITNAGNKTAGSTALNNANGFHIENHEVFLENSKTLNTVPYKYNNNQFDSGASNILCPSTF